MRIVQILHGWPPASMGGTGLYVHALATALARDGHQVAVLAPSPTASGRPPAWRDRGEQHGWRGWTLELPPPQRFEQSWSRPRADGLLAAWLDRWRPDVVHVHHLAHSSLGWLRVARRQERQLVLSLHDYALPCARGQLVDAALQPCPGPTPERCAACLAPHLQLSPLTAPLGRLLDRWPGLRATARAGLARRAPRQGTLRLAHRQAAVARALTWPQRLLSPSHDLARRFATLGLRRPEVLPLPLVRPVPPAPPPPPGPLRILFASTVIPTKGPHRLVEAFAALPPGSATLTIAGPAPAFDGQPGYAERLRARVQTLPGATWAGALPADRIPGILAEHDLLVLPSTWPENSPLVLREASAAGLRLILPAQGGAAELAPQAPRVPAGDDDALLAALLAEVHRGRGRHPARAWPSPAEHAALLVGDVYRRSRGPASRGPDRPGPRYAGSPGVHT